MEIRYKVYKGVFSFCSVFLQHSEFNEESYVHIQSAAYKSFRGEGYNANVNYILNFTLNFSAKRHEDVFVRSYMKN